MDLFKLFGTIAVDNREANKALEETSGLAKDTGKAFGDASEESGGKFGNAMKKVGGVASKVGKTVAAGIGVASVAIAAIGKSAISAYADYEQLVGGVETLFGTGTQSIEEYTASIGKSKEDIMAFQRANGLVVDGIIGPKTSAAIAAQYEKISKTSTSAADLVVKNAKNAYKTAGLSANQYMETVTSFSASLIASVGGDSVKAAQLADQAIIDMSDNANKMG